MVGVEYWNVPVVPVVPLVPVAGVLNLPVATALATTTTTIR